MNGAQLYSHSFTRPHLWTPVTLSSTTPRRVLNVPLNFLYIRWVASPPSSNTIFGCHLSDVMHCSMHHQKSSSDSPFHAKMGKPGDHDTRVKCQNQIEVRILKPRFRLAMSHNFVINASQNFTNITDFKSQFSHAFLNSHVPKNILQLFLTLGLKFQDSAIAGYWACLCKM